MQEIKQFNVLVHPDFHLRSGYSSLTSSHIERRQRWDARTAELGNNPQALMLYFSAFLKSDGGLSRVHKAYGVNHVAYGIELQRIIRYKKQLDDRFIFFPGDQKPSKVILGEIFSAKGFFYTPSVASLIAYGEYAGACVNSWGSHLAWVLELSEKNNHVAKELSLPVEGTKFVSPENRFSFRHSA